MTFYNTAPVSCGLGGVEKSYSVQSIHVNYECIEMDERDTLTPCEATDEYKEFM